MREPVTSVLSLAGGDTERLKVTVSPALTRASSALEPVAGHLPHDARPGWPSRPRCRVQPEDPAEVGIGEPAKPVQPEIGKALG